MSVWWHDAVVYQVYPRSFADADGDGTGDLNGVRSRLPYLVELGVNAIWLSPFYPSPMADGGYDVADYCDVDPRFGSLGDFDALVAEAGMHGIRVIVDIVPNHCSDRHPAFQEALAAGPGNPERERFIFRDGRRGPGGIDGPPNNWVSMFGGSAWTQVPDGQWYLHLFDEAQPDWNWNRPDVAAMFDKILRFWLDRGVAGLRVDVAHGLFKDPELPELTGTHPNDSPSAYYHRPELHEHYRGWRTILDSYPDDDFPGARTAVGEFWGDEPKHVWPYLNSGGLPQIFNFHFLRARWDPAELRAVIDESIAATGSEPGAAPWVIGNHDARRPVTRYGVRPPEARRGGRRKSPPLESDASVDLELGTRRARAAALLLLALPGSAYIYQGDELGLPEVFDLTDEDRDDPVFRRTNGARIGRDGCRIPLPWSGSTPPYGFSAGRKTWLPQPADWADRTVAAQDGDPESMLSLYRAALRLRHAHPALGSGRLTWRRAAPGLLVFDRDPGFVFAANLGSETVQLPRHDEMLLASGPLEGDRLPPDTAVWLGVEDQ